MWNKKKILRALRYPIEGSLFWITYGLIRFLNIETASALVGSLARRVGPLTGAHRIGERNLRAALPNLTDQEIQDLLGHVWENFGRTIGEYPQLKNIHIYQDRRFEIVGAQYIDQMRDDGKPGIIVGAHLANWEIAIMAASQRGLDLAQVYRPANNPIVDRLIRSIQGERGNLVIPKSREGAKTILNLLQQKKHVFLLNDQKFHNGLAIPFFGYPAFTASAAARLALKFNCPLLPVQVERLEGVRFRITFHKPLTIQETGDLTEDTKKLTTQLSESIEKWVRHRPDQWLWIHRRWPHGFWDKKN